mmetsp:Transcript_4626/g.6923  ORF Transcript_4626/g.6923 Transcript_4626/m.6923 type:complete len:164 (-) Transcript_4626:554-1045(-)
MDDVTKAATRGLESLFDGTEEEIGQCFKSSSKCFSIVSKCIKRDGPCGKRGVMNSARAACFDIGKLEFSKSKGICSAKCDAHVRKLRGSTVALAGGKPGEGLNERQLVEWKECIQECQRKKALDAPVYKKCIQQEVVKRTEECAKEKCAQAAIECRNKNCAQQ